MDLRQFNTYKILSHIGTIKDLMSGKSPYPVSCEIDPSNLCNHGCSWCYFAGSRQADKKSLEEKLLFKLIEDLAGGGTKSVTFTGGGEPLINPAAPEAIRRAYSLGMRVGLVTNGGLLDKKKNKIIVSCCDFVRISLDAADEKSHNKLHNPHNPGKDNFKNILENLRILVSLRKESKKSITIGAGFLIHKENYKKLPGLARRLKEIGIDYLQIRPIVMPQDDSLTRNWAKGHKYIQKTMGFSDNKFYVFPIDYRYRQMITKQRSYQHCHIHNLLGIVGADGNVYLCSLFRGDSRFSFGNLYSQPFGRIWMGAKRKKLIRSLEAAKCPPCRYNRYNEILDYMLNKDKPHADFL